MVLPAINGCWPGGPVVLVAGATPDDATEPISPDEVVDRAAPTEGRRKWCRSAAAAAAVEPPTGPECSKWAVRRTGGSGATPGNRVVPWEIFVKRILVVV